MYLSSLEFDNFRNLKKGKFIPDKYINVIYGDNAQGKTNLIEAIWMFTGKKSFRSSKDVNLVNVQNKDENATLFAEFYSQGREQTASLSLGSKKQTEINSIKVKSASELAEKFCAVLFSPADMDLIKDGPSVRRKFLDNAISAIRPKYTQVLSNYAHAIEQRNALLKDLAFHAELEVMCDVYEKRIATLAHYIINQRKLYIDALHEYIIDIYNGFSGGKEKIEIVYECSCEDVTEKGLCKALKEARAEDMRTLSTSVGPHRDDFEIFINDMSIKNFGSQGQKRSAIVSLKLTEAEILKKYTGEQPIAILDDVMSELDLARQDYIVNHIEGWQVFITVCDPNNIKGLRSGKVTKIESGELVQ